MRSPAEIAERLAALEREGRAALAAEGAEPGALRTLRALDLRYRGTDVALAVDEPADGDWIAAFARLHGERYGYERPGRAIEAVAARVRVRAPERGTALAPPDRAAPSPVAAPAPRRTAPFWVPGAGLRDVPVHWREDLAPGASIAGPALVLDATGTIVVEDGFRAEAAASGALVLDDAAAQAGARDARSGDDSRPPDDPVRLEVAGSRFMAIAEQMGAVLRHTAVSTNIKERLDYSCAVFDAAGGLVANAPHIPVHLGAMGETVRALRAAFPDAAPGDAWVTNDPFQGGSHLPDVTVVTPVFGRAAAGAGVLRREPRAPRRYRRADAGLDAGRLAVPRGRGRSCSRRSSSCAPAGFDEACAPRAAHGRRAWPARNPDDNVADLEAMAAANRAGERLLHALVAEHGPRGRRGVDGGAAARRRRRSCGRELAALPDGERTFADHLDDGTPIRARHHDRRRARLAIDFAGTGAAVAGQPERAARGRARGRALRAARARRRAHPAERRLPRAGRRCACRRGSLLDPPPGSAVVGGNVETSQRVVDVLLGALGLAAASQGTMNNVAFGDARFGYYETIGGGAGAGPDFDGASGVHVHMTNTRITDAEVLETRFPVRLVALRAAPRHRAAPGAGAAATASCVAYAVPRAGHVSLLAERRTTRAVRPRRRRERHARSAARGAPRSVGRRATRWSRATPPSPSRAGDELWIETPGGGGYGALPPTVGEG